MKTAYIRPCTLYVYGPGRHLVHQCITSASLCCSWHCQQLHLETRLALASPGTNVLVIWNQCACLMEPMCLSYGTNVPVFMEPMCLSYGTNVLVLWNQCACLMEPMCLSYGINVLVLWNQCACLMEPMCLSNEIDVPGLRRWPDASPLSSRAALLN